jgi:glycosyltransferase involved in cell wall biosynthesis
MIKVTHLSSFDRGVGAAKANSTLHTALRVLDVDHRMLVLRKDLDDPTVQGQEAAMFFRLRARVALELDSRLIYRYYHPWEWWSLGLAGNTSIASHPIVKNADIVSLSWVSGFLSVNAIAGLLNIGKPIIWTLYDMWPFTGGCHYSAGCSRYTGGCGCCPQLGRKRHRDLSAWVWKRKHRQWKTDHLTVVCPSQWLADCARKSSLFATVDIRVIPTGVDTGVFHSRERKKARRALGLPQDKALVLFIASHGLGNERKGGQLLEKALLQLPEKNLSEPPDLVVLGGGRVSDEIALRFRVYDVRVQGDEELTTLYSACDVLIAPSREDNLPLTVLEAMACKTPCVAFHIGGMPDVIEHKINGYLATPFDSNDLAEGIFWLLSGSKLRQIGEKAAETIANGFTAVQEAQLYLKLYQEKLASLFQYKMRLKM